VRLIAEVGSVEAVSLRGIARAAGIDTMSIYRHFGSKEELVWAVLDAEFAELADALDEAESDFDDPVDRLRARCLAYVRFGVERSGEFVVLFGTEGRPTPPDVESERLPGWPVFAAFVTAVERCRPTSAADARTRATLLWVALHGATVLRLSKRGFPWPPLEQMVDELLRHLVIRPSS
jgi:AcrR family transcriptional regulator